MPHKDPEKRRASVREAVQRYRATGGSKPPRKPLPELATLRLETATDAVATLKGELERILTLCTGEESGEVLARARTVAGLLVTFLRAVEVAELLPRLEALEARAEEKRSWVH